MKKLLFVILILALIAIVSGCFLFRTKSVENDYISAIIKDALLKLPLGTLLGIELSIKKLIQEDNHLHKFAVFENWSPTVLKERQLQLPKQEMI